MFDPRDDARDRDGREDGRARVYDERDRDDDPREGLMRELDLPRGEELELVAVRDRVYELNLEDSRTLAAVGAFRVVPEHDLDIDHDTLDHLHDEGLDETVDLGDDERGLTLTREGRELLDAHSLDRGDEPTQDFDAGVSRQREVEHDSNLYATYRQEEARLREEHGGLEIRRVVLDHGLKRDQEFLQEDVQNRRRGPQPPCLGLEHRAGERLSFSGVDVTGVECMTRGRGLPHGADPRTTARIDGIRSSARSRSPTDPSTPRPGRAAVVLSVALDGCHGE
jgi:hypothetical protein